MLTTGFKTDKKNYELHNKDFSKELIELKEFFHIPGLSVIIKHRDQTVYESYLGFADVNKGIPMDSSTTIPMASLTKIFTGILIMQLVENKKLSLDEPINKYVSNVNIGDSIKIKHVLSHTSQGNVGKHFYYSSRFSWLTAVIEKVTGHDFEKNVKERIIKPLGLKNTYLLKDSFQVRNENRKIAMPYFYEGQIKDGFIDYGYSAASGITSTVRDLAIFGTAMDNNSLITEESMRNMFNPFNGNLPYGLGIFTQKFKDQDLIWGYGQYDCYSSLFLKVTSKDLTYIIAANNSLMSDPARLIYGDVTYSLFALSFLKNYVLDLPKEPLFENTNSLKSLEERITPNNSAFYLKKLLAQSVAESFMAMHETGKSEVSKNILEKVFKLTPDYDMYADLTVLHNLSFLKTIAMHKEKRKFTKFDAELEMIGTKLLAIDNNNPYANYYMADHYSKNGSNELAVKYFSKIVDAKNFSRNWYTTEAEIWLKNQKKKSD